MAHLKVSKTLFESSIRGALHRYFARVSKSTSAAEAYQTPSQASTDFGNAKPFTEMPGEKGWPLVGVISALPEMVSGKVGKDSYAYKLHVKYGPTLRIYVPGFKWTVYTNTPEGVEAAFRAEGKYPSRGLFLEKTTTDIHKQNKWPSGLIFAYGENWKRIRSAMSKQVIPRRVGNLTDPLCGVTDDLLNHLEGIDSGKVDDITPIITKWAFQNTAYFVFGENLDVHNAQDKTTKEFMEAGLEFIKQAGLFIPIPIFNYFPQIFYKKLINAVKRMRELGHQVMEKKAAQWSEDIARGTVDETKAVGILEQWLIEGKLEPEDALTQACDLLSAGLDTTTNTSTFMLYELAKQPALQDQLCHEIKAVLGDKVNPSWEDLQNIPLVRNCLKETLRLYPALEGNFREIMEDTVIDGYHVPAGTNVIASQALMSHDEQYFEEPLKFIPERWSKNKEEIPRFASLPFGFGQRACYGRRLAELEMHILLTKLISRFTLSTDKNSIAVFQSTVLKPKEPVPITFKKRS